LPIPSVAPRFWAIFHVQDELNSPPQQRIYAADCILDMTRARAVGLEDALMP
jgi:hypothetical protein